MSKHPYPPSGFQNKGADANFQHRSYTSWGRTRSPKNILSSHRAGINANGDGKVLTFGGADASVTCVTENQRFLHVHVSAVTNGGKLTVTGLMYAAGSNEMTLKTVHGDAAELAAAGTLLIDLSGIDRVKFTVTDTDGNDAGTCTFHAACSTF